jgi:hypothetical protein
MTNEEIKALEDVQKAATYALGLGLTDRQITDAVRGQIPLPSPEVSGGLSTLSNSNSLIDPKPPAYLSPEDLLGGKPIDPKK